MFVFGLVLLPGLGLVKVYFLVSVMVSICYWFWSNILVLDHGVNPGFGPLPEKDHFSQELNICSI